MKTQKKVKEFLKGKGDSQIKKIIKKGGLPGSEKKFNKILKRASQPLPK